MPVPAIPRATYRLQLNRDFTFADAEAIIPYLAQLGISHLYVSPILKARAGSTHGYDIVDHNQFNPEIGDRAALERLGTQLAAHGMGLIIDIVPNHMGVGYADNVWWLDVLEWGEDSPYARFFDIDWQPPRRELKGKVLLPFLGDHYGAVLERGELVPKFDRTDGALSVWYWEHRYPIAVADYAGLLQAAVPEGGAGDALLDVVLEFRQIASSQSGRNIQARRTRAVQAKARLAGLAAAQPALADAIDHALAALAADRAALNALLERQHYRVSFWRVAADEINYRRFFDINDLAALRMVEEPELFARAHRLPMDLVRAGLVHGLRVDHVDGLFNPAEYCRQVQARAAEALGVALKGPDDQPLPLWVEKILAHHEPLRRDWPVAGTTGYDFANLVNGLFVAAEAEAALTATYARFIGFAMDFDAQVVEAKKRIIDEHMSAELRVLAGRLGRIAASHWRSRDFTLSVLVRALKEVVAWLPVYRTYVTSRRVTENDLRYIQWALAKARRASPLDPTVFDFVGAVLDTSLARDGQYSRRAVVDFTMRLQQYSGPVMAKGFEDTALYRFNRLISLNEVGGEPLRFGLTPAAFHQASRARQRTHPHTLLATATHDTKRGEDTRVRIDVLSELPEEWRQHLERWSQLNQPFRKQLESGPAPEPNDEIWIYQTMLGAWPDDDVQGFVDRLAGVVVKAVREAKRRSWWAHPDEAYEQAVVDFVRRIAETERRNPFLEDFLGLRRRMVPAGQLNGLAQTLLKLTVPGVPDIYQGCELWDLSLVDPDNRRPVDYALRRELLDRFHGRPLPAAPADWRDGAVKQALIRRTLDLRRRRPDLFEQGAYRPLAVRGPRAAHVVAFARSWNDAQVVVVVPVQTVRLWPDNLSSAPVGAVWRGVHVEAPKRGGSGRFRDLLSGDGVEAVSRRGTMVLPLTDLFAAFPLALLEGEGNGIE
ncbi:MAG: malto-oligosyltrehalose synthase [Magnetospirillum sp.]|nr:malto-oligosyltrehalose synthase [Magnetospirillum sp.]